MENETVVGKRQSLVCKGYTWENLEQKQVLKIEGEEYVLFYKRKSGKKNDKVGAIFKWQLIFWTEIGRLLASF